MKLRSIVALLLAAVMLLGCTAAVAEDKVQVKIWHTFTNEQEAYLNKTAEDFNASQDKYEVLVQTQPYANFTSTVYNAVVNHEGPDIIFNYASEAAKYVSANLVANLDEYIYDPEIGFDIENLLPAYLLNEINGFEDGHIHYLPGATTGPILYYNKTMLQELNLEVPKTWEELEAVSKAIKAAKPDVTPFGIDSKVDITQTVMACEDMSATRTGALIVFERSNMLEEQILSGTVLNAEITAELLKNIFFVKAPLHDGAVIIRGGKIAGAGCVLPLTGDNNLSPDLGTRHRAGIGMSEQSDAVVIIVSEETGGISIAVDGMLKRRLSRETFEAILRSELLPKEKGNDQRFDFLKKWLPKRREKQAEQDRKE